MVDAVVGLAAGADQRGEVVSSQARKLSRKLAVGRVLTPWGLCSGAGNRASCEVAVSGYRALVRACWVRMISAVSSSMGRW